jgi:hypothetical protein
MASNCLHSFVRIDLESARNFFPSFTCTAHSSQNWSQKSCPNLTPTLTRGSSRATHFFCCTPFNVAMSFSKVSFLVVIFSFTCTYCTIISSVICVVIGFFSFFALSCTACLTIPYATTSSFITLNASSCNNSSLCERLCCSSMIWFIS